MRTRLDQLLVERGLAPSREKAKALIQRGLVLVEGRPAQKAAQAVPREARIELLAEERYVGRGAYKLLGALEAFPVQVAGRVALDLGAGTGGFTQVLLERGAQRVYAVDVGHAQLHPSLRAHPRVVALEGVDAREVALPEAVDLLVMDLSFISATRVLPRFRDLLRPGGEALVLVKPQFELGPGHRVVRAEALRQEALERVKAKAREVGLLPLGEAESPLAGKEGNREWWLWLKAP